MPATRHSRQGLVPRLTTSCMVKRRMFPASERSDAEPGYTLTRSAEQKESICLAEEAIYVGFAINTSAWSFYVPERKKIVTTNLVKFSEHEFPFRKRSMVEKHLMDNSTDMLFQHPSDVKWVPYNKFHVGNYDKVHYDKISDVMVLRVVSESNTYTSTCMSRWQHDRCRQVFSIFSSFFFHFFLKDPEP